MAAPQIVWFRNDLRLSDQAALRAAAEAGPIVPVFVLDEESPDIRPMGGASRWWLHHSLSALDASLRKRGGRLLLLRGRAAALLAQLAERIGAGAVHAIQQAEPWWPGLEAEVPRLQLHLGQTLVPPGLLHTKTGGRFRVFTPFWRALNEWGDPPLPAPAPAELVFAPLPDGEALADWELLPSHPNWASGFGDWTPGEAGALGMLEDFLPRLRGYAVARDFPSQEGTSRLSPHLHFGEISPAQAWHAALAHAGPDAEAWLRQLAWRDFAQETLGQFPDTASRAHRDEFERMPWTEVTSKEGAAQLAAWQCGRTGYPLVDAGMRQLWETGWMHNRVRMVAASFLAKHLLIDWRHGERWFWDTLVDADLANNGMGWQWVMGSGVDSAPYFRIFAPLRQSAKFDAAGYIRRWVPELAGFEDGAMHGPFPDGPNGYPPPIIAHGFARERALAAYAKLKA
ncbi:cryptochrome/photolyase family protein [Sandaracinobacteroides hominis]|uniref:cryptochrome/photolyase family protein n=1 Tax=Sandaracinobacteroides hominis TaxID=2780086 RepID=UPI0018F3778A|nr:deoxyribodipyrimidine photo-lyase [Sandaracinobacteroides hominis]